MEDNIQVQVVSGVEVRVITIPKGLYLEKEKVFPNSQVILIENPPLGEKRTQAY